ncbi:MAG: hypothetical protein ABI851_10825 [Saprospiraceae bacterium]
MKKIILAILSIAFISFQTNAQTADEIIEKNIKSMGGAEKLKSIESLVFEGQVNSQGMEIPITITTLKNKGWRMEINVMGMSGWMIVRPDSGWVFMPFQGQSKPEAMTQDQLKESIEQLDLEGELVNYKEKGHTVEYIGMDDVEGTECHKLKILTKSGNVHYELIDPVSFFTVRKISKQKAGGKEVEVQTDLGNYKEVEGGFMFPHTITSMGGPFELKKITVNGKISPDKFTAGM